MKTTLWKPLACLLMAVTVAPTASGSKPVPAPLPDEQPDFNTEQSNPARPPVVVIVAQDNITVIKRVACSYRQNVGACLDSGGATFQNEVVAYNASDYDTNTTCTFLNGRAKIGSYLGPYATAYLNYDYYDLYIESDIKLRAAEM